MTEGARRARLARAALALALGLALAPAGLGFSCAEETRAPTAIVRGEAVQLEVVRTREEQALGLGNRGGLAWGHGMLFPYERPGFPTFWMKRMRFDIDIVWIREGRIVGIAHRVPWPREDPDRPATASAPELVDMVLEVPAGYAQAKGWRRGDRVELRGL